jgi:hypothetical protein
MWTIVIGEVAASVTLLPDEKTYRTGVWSAGTGPIWYGDHFCLKIARNICLEAIKAELKDPCERLVTNYIRYIDSRLEHIDDTA